MRAAAKPFLWLLLLVSAGCWSDRSHWLYGLSRQAYDSSKWRNSDKPWAGPEMHGTGSQALIVPFMVLLPFLIDTAIFPVTATHDLLVAR